MKYHPGYFRYVKQEYKDLVDQVNADRVCAQCFQDYLATTLGYLFIALSFTAFAPVFVGLLYIEWFKGRKPYEDAFIEKL
jgi:hypothetical protein